MHKALYKKIASESFKNGYNCAQSLLSAFGPELGLSRELALKMTTGLGAGVNYSGNTCGAVIGAFLVLGLKNGIDKPHDKKGKERTREVLEKFISKFRESYPSLLCREILGADVSKPEELELLRKEDKFSNYCPHVVEVAAAIVEELLDKNYSE
jgi:C_GCAxxG_C_C family probable redox protein